MLKNLPFRKPVDKPSVRILITFNHSSDVRFAIVCAKLTEEDIPYEVIDESIGTLEPFMSAFGGPKIVVHHRFYERALSVLNTLDLAPYEVKPTLRINYFWLAIAILLAVTLVYWWYSRK